MVSPPLFVMILVVTLLPLNYPIIEESGIEKCSKKMLYEYSKITIEAVVIVKLVFPIPLLVVGILGRFFASLP